MNKRSLAEWMGAAFLVTFCAGCRSSAIPTIAVIPQTTGPELWESVHAGAENAAYKTGYHIYWNAPTREDDVEGQTALVEKVIAREYQGLILAPDQYLASMTPVREALTRHIPTVVIRSALPIPAGPELHYILNDEDEMGRLAAMRIGELLHGKGTVAILGIDPNVAGITLRWRSFETVLAARFPHVVIVERRTGSVNTEEAQQIADEVLAQYSGVSAILALNVAATQGSIAALQTMPKGSSTRLISCDQELGVMAALRNGEVDSVVIEDTYAMGYRAVQEIAAGKRGESVPDVIRLKPVLVTRENIDTPQIQKMLSGYWRLNP